MRKLLLLALLMLPALLLHGQNGDDWSEIMTNKTGTVVFYWYPNNISIADSKDIIDGVEHDLAVSFVRYLNEKYEVDVEVQWIQTASFGDVMSNVSEAESGGVFGASSISITPERQEYLSFTPPYLADVAVLISSAEVPIAHTPYEFRSIFNKLTAVSIRNTTLNESLISLRKEQGLNFDIQYVQNSGQIIERVAQMDNGFGYIDLPNFLVTFDNNPNIRRQFFHPIKQEGLAMIYPPESDWKEPVEDYFNSRRFQLDRNEIITRYLGKDVTDIVGKIANSADFGPLEEIVISNKEKESQYENLLDAALREKERSRINNMLILVTIVTLLVLLLLYISNRIKTKTNRLLTEQQNIIESRNRQLQILNEEKNDLIKILAHDLRSPLSSITGFSMLLKKSKNFSKEDHEMNDFISQSSEKMQSMITKILDVDAIETGKRNMMIEPFDINEVISSVMNSNKAKAEKKKIELIIETKDSSMILADRFYTEQILENLVSNAIKFSDKNTQVRISSDDIANHIRISVMDQGPGFSEEDQKKIFKKYQRLSAQPTAGEDSVGLGLSIVKFYTEMMKGKISFKTEPGQGTEFIIDLPKV